MRTDGKCIVDVSFSDTFHDAHSFLNNNSMVWREYIRIEGN